MPTKVSSIKKGDKFWCLHRQLGKPMLGLVICLTPQPGKLVGLQFEEAVPEGVAHLDLDGRAKKGFCIWAHPDFLLTDAEFKEKGQLTPATQPADLDELPLV